MAPSASILLFVSALVSISTISALPQKHNSFHKNVNSPVCKNHVSPFDYSAKLKRDDDAPICPNAPAVDIFPLSLDKRAEEDYSCSESKPCKNGACCPKATGYCNFGDKYCGTNGQSPNEVCWSNCNAKAECGRDADLPGKKCPLNVCCSKFGFCGMTEEFCDKGTKEDPGCQSNCDQPGSGGSGGIFQDFKNIPTGALTHLYFSFGYISPGSFDLVPMDDLEPDLFEHNMVSTAENRAAFIRKLFAFMRQYAFDGVDFDWEYPGAPDRGGRPEDGKNFVTFLEELDEANKKQQMHYTVSFTVPTSFWYLRHFDLKAVDYVDFVNVMSYDLHGVWDATNPIGNKIYGHSNLTEIRLALDLFWRNNIKPEKLNLGLGFYGRSFQLANSACHQPGCTFKGGAAPGPCSKNSGTLTYKEIQDIIKKHKIRPYHDKEAAVKYITWDNDQWVSYDDEDTFKAKINFANKLGLGGLLIWAIDQDTDDLMALNAVISPKSVTALAMVSDNEAYWDDATVPDCYVTDCGGTCKAGFFKITNQPCGGAKAITRHSKEKDSELCCPTASAPDPKQCHWRGSAPSCNGHCHDSEILLQMNRWGDGKYCEDGNKAYCCESPTTKDHGCYWAGVGKHCNNEDVAMTFSGTFLSTVADIADAISLIDTPLVKFLDALDMDLKKLYCCPRKSSTNFKNCRWYGDSHSSDTCYDNHCPVGKQVQLTDSPYGFGESCFPRMERTRVYCCEPANGEKLFLPVPLDRLFKDPPKGDNVDTDFKLHVDPEFGSNTKHTDNDPGNAAFQFVVLASPEELQHSLDKRDGSHWELFNCKGGLSEEEQTIKMFCTDFSENSNCHKIGLGHGVPGTILEMPDGCGAGRYAVAKSMVPSKDQTIPHRLAKRYPGDMKPKVYDLTFDYDFRRVPRDVGETHMRIDFSNKDNYWDNIVAAASKRKAKRSLEDMGGNHKRWLEEEWRDDYHFGGLSHEELHKRWFGSDILSWLKNLVKGEIKKEFTHEITDQFIAKIIDDKLDCPPLHTHILVQALTDVKVSTSFGFTLITKLDFKNPGSPLDLSNSYLTFTNSGKVTATFTLDALIEVTYTKDDLEILKLPFPGASFRVPGIVTIGPELRILGGFNLGLSLSAEIEAKVDLADWEIRHTLPAAEGFEPKIEDALDAGDSGDQNGLLQPQFYAGVMATGKAEAHLKVNVEFGIRFDERWKVGAATAGVTADGYVRLDVGVGKSTVATCPFTYGVTLGARLYASVETPPQFGWGTKTWPLPGSGEIPVIPGGKCPDLREGQPDKRGMRLLDGTTGILNTSSYREIEARSTHAVSKRIVRWGPPFHIPTLKCPNGGASGDASGSKCEKLSHVPGSSNEDLAKREPGHVTNYHHFEKRDTKTQQFCKGRNLITIVSAEYPNSGEFAGSVPGGLTYGYTNPATCTDFGFGQIGAPANTALYATEHILEFQMIQDFFTDYTTNHHKVTCYNPSINNEDSCHCIANFWFKLKAQQRPIITGEPKDPIDHIGAVFPGHKNQWRNELVLLDKEVNNIKEGFWGVDPARNENTLEEYAGHGDSLFKNIKDTIMAIRYHTDATIRTSLIAQKNRVGDRLELLETTYLPNINKDINGKIKRTWRYLGLRAEWNTFMRTRAATAITDAFNHVERYLTKLEEGYATQAQRNFANNAGDTEDGRNLRGFIAKIDALRAEWNNNRPTWPNPF
ncbi:glycoside hydrolase family 18 protein [Amniculicola lignicola CBS 123094]|uniref:chitinase n=1 Tax=Amniculicola lignicola CBS 123094 TaxID=1392246 RepID=A0A6A5WXE2_9PLEO|nr:glycoside hydrolase family 18 protein [Amniculicola lignicola CBS 123094]